jgi:type I restriction enzyme S subunit
MNADRLLAHYEQIAEAPDAIARLRRFVLNLAIRGKLVPQDLNDEPASELLKRIAAEMARLVKAGEIRKPRVLPDVENPPFEVPQNWQWTPVRAIASDRGQEVPQSTFTYIDVTSIDKEAGVVADPKVLEASEAPSRARKITRKGDVIYSCVRPSLLNVAVVETDFDPQPIASTAFAILNGHGLVMPRYLWIVLRSPFMVECVEENQRGQAYPAINDADFAVLPFPLPPLAEQRRIVAKVDELMGLCDWLEAVRAGREAVRDRLAAASLGRLNAPDPQTFQEDARFALNTLPALTTRPDQIKQLRQTILNLAVRGKLVPQDLNDEPASELLKRIAKEKARLLSIGEISRDKVPSSISADDEPFSLPASWRWCRLRSLASALGDGLHGTPNYVTGTKCYFINGNNLEDGRIVIKATTKTVSAEEMRKHKKPLNQHSVLVSINGTLGKVAFYEGQDIVLGKSACYFNLTVFTNRSFAKLVLDSPYFTKYAVKKATGTTIKNLSLNAMNEFPFPLPPLSEQHRIVVKVDELMELCDWLEASLTAAATTRRRLLEALLAEALAPAEDQELEAAE